MILEVVVILGKEMVKMRAMTIGNVFNDSRATCHST